MSGEIEDEFSIWSGQDKDLPAHLIPVAPPRQLQSNGAPVVEQSHEFVISELPLRQQKLPGSVPEGNGG
jgi:hypothetical protein